MKYFFDTEFYEDGERIHPISIGIVSEDNREYYAEFPLPFIPSDHWVIGNVLPLLNNTPKEKEIVTTEIIKFVGQQPEFWAYYADYDWVLLCQLFGTMMDLPEGWPMYCRDLKQLIDDSHNTRFPKQADGIHNALEDARWVKETYGYLRA